MSGTNLGSAYVQILPTTKGIKNNIEKELNKDFNKIGQSVSKSFFSGFDMSGFMSNAGKAMSSVGDTLTKNITKPITALATALGGATLFKGFKRLSDIDEATAKLYGLGHEGMTVQKIMDNALSSVKGTAFGLGEAATTASNAVAAGIKPGKELERYLSVIADTAAIAGVEMSDMGSIFNKVATGGKLSAMELNQITDRGIPIVQMLSKSMNVAAEDIRDMVSAGEIGLPELLNAFDTNIGGAAKKMGELSFKASWDNMWASVSRLGAAFLGAGDNANGFFGQLKSLFGELTKGFDKLAPIAEEWGEKFGKAFKTIVDNIRDGIKWFNSLSAESKKLIGVVAGSLVFAGPLLKLFGGLTQGGGLLAGVLGKVSGSFGILLSPLSSVVSKFSGLSSFLPKLISKLAGLLGLGGQMAGFGTALGGIFAVLGVLQLKFGEEIEAILLMVREKVPMIIGDFVTKLVEGIPQLIEAGIVLMNSLLETIVFLLPSIIQGGGQILLSLIEGITTNLPQLMPTVVLVVSTLIEQLGLLLPELIFAGLDMLMAISQGITDNIGLIIESITTVVENLLKTLFERLPEFIEKGFEIIKSLAEGIIENLPTIIESLGNIVSSLLTFLIENMPMFLLKGVEIIRSLANGLIENLPQILTSIGTVIGNVLNSIASSLPEFISKGMEMIVKIALGLIKQLPTLIRNIPGIIRSILSAFGKIATGMFNIGKNIVKGLWNGINNVKDWILGKISGFVNSIIGGIKSFFGIKSPSRVMANEVGKFLPSGLAVGIEKNLKPVSRAMDEMGEIATREFEADLGFNTKNINEISSKTRDMFVSGKTNSDIALNANLVLGSNTYKLLVEDISKEQDRQLELKLAY